MGYTHYYRRRELKHNKRTFKAFVEDVKKVVAALPPHSQSSGAYCKDEPLKLAGWDGTGEPVFNEDEISFNGAGDELSHETLLIPREFKFGKDDYGKWKAEEFKASGEVFAFCKTARKPYDLAVQAVLILYKEYFGDKVKISSDGEADDWKSAFELVSSVLGRKLLPINEAFNRLTGHVDEVDESEGFVI